MHLCVFRKDIKLCKALKIMSVNRRDCWNGGETEKGFWREGRIWLESRSVSIPETAWSNRELSQTKHFWTSVWHREAELLPRPDLTAHSQCTDPEHSVSSSATTFFCVCRTMLPNRGKATWESSQQVVQCIPVLTSRSEETLSHYFALTEFTELWCLAVPLCFCNAAGWLRVVWNLHTSTLSRSNRKPFEY